MIDSDSDAENNVNTKRTVHDDEDSEVKKNLKNKNFLRMYLALLCCSRKEIRKEKLLRKMRTMKTYMSKMLLSLTRKL